MMVVTLKCSVEMLMRNFEKIATRLGDGSHLVFVFFEYRDYTLAKLRGGGR